MIPVSVSKVLIIEDDEVIAQGMAAHLAAAGFDPLWVNKGEPGLARLRFEKPDGNPAGNFSVLLGNPQSI